MQTKIVTRYSESDALGHISNVSYLIYFEQARVDFILGTRIIGDIKDWPFVLASTHCDYKKQLHVNQNIVVKTFVKRIGLRSFTLGHQIFIEDTGELAAEGEGVIVHFDFVLQKSTPLTDEMIKRLKQSVVIEEETQTRQEIIS
ncbi:acyl-CoA thioesterase [Bacillus sp. V3-13]|uniref:acyl-CoA thioesterase n=1 Tax=Bacillus sp. V3-13 TaxID=2053728 RepID=UPI0015E1545D|nr:thioesterase family protein [Bacillus sp. V3-13]